MAWLVTYSYDPAGRRIVRQTPVERQDLYYNETWQVVEVHRDEDPGPLEQWVWDSRYVDAAVVRFYDANTDRDCDDAGTGDNVLYPIHDANWNVTGVVDAAAGLQPRPKPWQNLRSNRATELADLFPGHVVDAWPGHTEAANKKFYRQMTEAHFERAIGVGEKAARNPAQQLHVSTRGKPQSPTGGMQNRPVFPALSSAGENLRLPALGAEGFEPPTKRL